MKKLLNILLILLLIAGCTGNRPSQDDSYKDGSYYVEQLRNFKTGDKSESSPTDNTDFDKFCNDVFIELMESDYINMHYYVTDYKAMGIEKPSVDIGDVEYGLDEEIVEYSKGVLDDLHEFDYESLSKRQQYDYDTIEFSYLQDLAFAYYYQYSFVFSMKDNIMENLISIFTDFTFYDKESVDDYILLIDDFDRYINDALVYTADQAKDGYPLADEWIDYARDVCSGLTNKKEDNELIVSFDNRIDALDFLSVSQKESYKQRNREIVLNEVIPVSDKVYEELGKYYGSATAADYSPCNIGRKKGLFDKKTDMDYADMVYNIATSSNYSIDDIYKTIYNANDQLMAEYRSCFYDDDSYNTLLAAENNELEIFDMDGEETVEYLIEHYKEYFPLTDELIYSIQSLDPDTAPDTAIAYYWQAPVDNENQNIIRTNPNNMNGGYETYGTLAHEGVPGHMYQTVYLRRNNPNYLRNLMSFISYTEGWAVYATYYAMAMAGLEDDYVASAIFYDDNYYFFVYSLIDLMANYYGYSNERILNIISRDSIFSFDSYQIDNIVDLVRSMPGVYLYYGYGCSKLMELRDNISKKLGDGFDIVEFNKAILDAGDMPLNILEEYLYDYFEIS